MVSQLGNVAFAFCLRRSHCLPKIACMCRPGGLSVLQQRYLVTAVRHMVGGVKFAKDEEILGEAGRKVNMV